MKRMPVLAISAPLLLIGAAHPDLAAHHDGTAASSATATGPATYRPCRPGAGDDRCIQLYERGVRASYARWLRDRRGGEQLAQAAVGGSEPPVHRPGRHRSTAPAPHPAGETRCPEPAAHRPAARAHDAEGGETRGM